MKKRFFIEILKEICSEENLKLEIYSHEWMCKITDPKTNKHVWTEGYNFDLNSGVNYLVLYDKVLTSEVLINGEIPNVEHLLILKEDWRKYLQIEKTAKEEVIDILSKISLPVVVKLNNGSQGNGVYLCESEREVQNMVEVLKNKQSLAISKYYNCEFEYRFYILDGEILFAYKKIKTNGWRHNLSLGAKAELIDERFEKYTNLKELSLKTFNCLGIRCGAIDILDTSEGLKVLEVNNGIMMDGFASTCPEYFEIAKQAHKKMLSASFKKIL